MAARALMARAAIVFLGEGLRKPGWRKGVLAQRLCDLYFFAVFFSRETKNVSCITTKQNDLENMAIFHVVFGKALKSRDLRA